MADSESQLQEVVRAEYDPGVRRRFSALLDLADEEVRPHIKEDRIRRIMVNFRNESETKQLQREEFILEYGPPSDAYVRENYDKYFCGYRDPEEVQHIWHTVNSVSNELYHLFGTTLVGAGSQGIVRIGKFGEMEKRHRFLNVVAVKTVFNEPDYPHRIIAAKDEGRCMRILTHANFLKWHTTVKEEKTGHIHTSMEYFPGAPLSLWKAKYAGRFDVDLIRHIAWETLEGLRYMHIEQLMVHRDIALENILMDVRLRIKIIDLGSVLNKRDLYPTRVVEHPRIHLMASEAYHKGEWTPAADIWSFGLVLMQLVYNGLPLDETSEGMSNHAQDARAMEGDIGDFFKRCLARRARNRWSAAQLLEHPWLKDYSPQPL